MGKDNRGRKRITNPKEYFTRDSFLNATPHCWKNKLVRNYPLDLINRANAIFSLFDNGLKDVLTRFHLTHNSSKLAFDVKKFQPIIKKFRDGLKNNKSDIYQSFDGWFPNISTLLVPEINNEYVEDLIKKYPHFEPLTKKYYKEDFCISDYFIIIAYWEIYGALVALSIDNFSAFQEKAVMNFGLVYNRKMIPTGKVQIIGQFGGNGIIKTLDLLQANLPPISWLELINQDLTRIHMFWYMKSMFPKQPILNVCRIEYCKFLFFGAHNAKECSVHKQAEKEFIRKRDTRSNVELINTIVKLITEFSHNKIIDNSKNEFERELHQTTLARIEKINISKIPRKELLKEAEKLCFLVLDRENNGESSSDNIKVQHSSVLYNLACIYSLRNKKAQAFEYLEKAIEAGYPDIESIKNDEDFKNIRDLIDTAFSKNKNKKK